MTKIYIVSAIHMEPYSDYGSGPAKAFLSEENAEKFIKENDKVYDEGYFRWDEKTDTNIQCYEFDDGAIYEYGWAYGTFIQEIELVD